jgi:hypothetical protein
MKPHDYFNPHLLRSQIALVPDKHYFYVLVGGEVLSLIEPPAYALERADGGDIVDEDDSNGASVVGAGDGPKRLLAGLALRMLTVSQICSLTILEWLLMVLEPNSTPIVASESILN